MRQMRYFDREGAFFIGGALLILAVAISWGHAVWADGRPATAAVMMAIAGATALCTCGFQLKRLSARRVSTDGGRN